MIANDLLEHQRRFDRGESETALITGCNCGQPQLRELLPQISRNVGTVLSSQCRKLRNRFLGEKARRVSAACLVVGEKGCVRLPGKECWQQCERIR